MLIKPKWLKEYYLPTIILNNNSLKFTDEHKYLGIIIDQNMFDDKDILQQAKALYVRGNVLVSKFKRCDTDVKVRLFKTYCTSFYGCNLWAKYRKCAMKKMRSAYYSIFRKLFNHKDYADLHSKMLDLGLDDFKVIIRKVSYSLYKTLMISDNKVLNSISESLYFKDSCIYKEWSKNFFMISTS